MYNYFIKSSNSFLGAKDLKLDILIYFLKVMQNLKSFHFLYIIGITKSKDDEELS